MINWAKRIHVELSEFQHKNRLFVWVLWVTLWVAWTLLAWLAMSSNSFLTGALATLPAGYITWWGCANRWNKLTARMGATAPVVWTVSVNGVCTGKLSDADYAGILRTVYFDLRTHTSQLMHFIAGIFQLGFKWVRLFAPGMLFYAGVVYWGSSPSEFASTLDNFKTVNKEDLNAAMPTLMSLVGVFVAINVGILAIWRRDFRFSRFDDAIAEKVLQAIGYPATGQVTLSQVEHGTTCEKYEVVN